jgi:hypothetical protein
MYLYTHAKTLYRYLSYHVHGRLVQNVLPCYEGKPTFQKKIKRVRVWTGIILKPTFQKREYEFMDCNYIDFFCFRGLVRGVDGETAAEVRGSLHFTGELYSTRDPRGRTRRAYSTRHVL